MIDAAGRSIDYYASKSKSYANWSVESISTVSKRMSMKPSHLMMSMKSEPFPVKYGQFMFIYIIVDRR